MFRGSVAQEIVHISILQIFNLVGFISLSFSSTDGTHCLIDIKYTPCPAWILCDRRSTCPFKHFDAVPTSQEPERVAAPPSIPPPPPPPPSHVYYPPPPPPPATAYAPSTHLHPNPVEVSGTTYFPFTHDIALADEYSYPVSAPVPTQVAAPVPIPLPTHFLAEYPPPMSPPPSYHYVPQEHQPHVEQSALEPEYVSETSAPQAPPGPAPIPDIPAEDARLIHPGPASCQDSVPEVAPAPVPAPKPEELVTSGISAEPDPEDQRRKRRSNGHVRRISINIKTGEVVERTLEGRHGVYGL